MLETLFSKVLLFKYFLNSFPINPRVLPVGCKSPEKDSSSFLDFSLTYLCTKESLVAVD